MVQAPAVPSARSRRSAWAWLGWFCLVGFILLIAVLIWAWTQRYSLAEQQIVKALDERGFETELRVQDASTTSADIRNIHLRYAGVRVVTIERLQADYQWRDLLNGQIEALKLTGLSATINVNEAGELTDPWVPKSASGAETPWPSRGVTLESATLNANSPYGLLRVKGDAELNALDNIQFRGDIAAPSLRYAGAELIVEGPLTADRNANILSFDTSGLQLSIDHPAASFRETQLSTKGTVDLTTLTVSADAQLEGGQLSSSLDIEGQLETVAATGTYNPESGLNARITPTIKSLRVVNAERRQSLAETLSLAATLEDVPVARNFSPTLVAPLEKLLSGADMSGQIAAKASDKTRELRLLSPLSLTQGETRLGLEAEADAPFYQYERGSGQYEVRAMATLSKPIPLTLSPLSISIASSDGVRVDGIRSAQGRLETRSTWRSRTPEGQPARMGPLDVRFAFERPEEGSRALTLQGSADYDGDIPGGYVQGLNAGGRLLTQLTGERPIVRYTPNGPLQFDKLDTDSEWGLEDFKGTIKPDGPVFSGASRQSAKVTTGLSDVTVRAVRDASSDSEPADMDITLASATLNGIIRGDRQNWDIVFGPAQLLSETFPVPGTDLTLSSGNLAVELSAQNRTQFEFKAPASTLNTPLYTLTDMSLDATGTAEAYTLNYAGGQVKFITDPDSQPLPVMPATGALRFADGTFTGEARTHLPRAADQPFDVTYTLKDGRGTADVAIKDLRFRPRGLQPQDLVQALRGKIAQVEGPIDADLTLRFGGDAPLSGSGLITMKNISMGTAPGPVTGMSGTVQLTSLFPVVSAPDQTLSLDLFDPGIPLRDGRFRYALVENGVQVIDAAWPLGEGQITIDPFTWDYSAAENQVILRVSGVEVGEFLKDFGEGRLSATGTLEGRIPVIVRGIEVLVQGGRLDVPGGGLIRYRGDDALIEKIPNQYAAEAIKALEDFKYDSLFAEIDGPLGGEIKVGLAFTGNNKDVLFGVPFAFDMSVEGELFNIARSFNTNATIKSQIGSNFRLSE